MVGPGWGWVGTGEFITAVAQLYGHPPPFRAFVLRLFKLAVLIGPMPPAGV